MDSMEKTWWKKELYFGRNQISKLRIFFWIFKGFVRNVMRTLCVKNGFKRVLKLGQIRPCHVAPQGKH